MSKSNMDIKEIFQTVRLGNLEKYNKLVVSFDINLTNEYGQNLLFESIVHSRYDISKDLISRSVDLSCQDNRGQTVLHYAALHNEFKIAELIIRNGGNVNICDNYGNNALWTAVFNARGKYSIVELYVKAGGNVKHKNKNEKSPFDFAMQIKDHSLIRILE